MFCRLPTIYILVTFNIYLQQCIKEYITVLKYNRNTSSYMNPIVTYVAEVGNYSYQFFICLPRDCVSRHNGGTSGAPLKPLRVDSALKALSTLRGLRGAHEVPPLCRETQSLGQQMLKEPLGINGLSTVYEFWNNIFVYIKYIKYLLFLSPSFKTFFFSSTTCWPR